MKRIVILTLALAAMAGLQRRRRQAELFGRLDPGCGQKQFRPDSSAGDMTRNVEQNGASITAIETQTGGPQGEVTIIAKYSTDGEATTNQLMGGDAKSTAKWDGDALVIVTNTKLLSTPITVTERWTLSDDGKIMTVRGTLSCRRASSPSLTC